MANSNDEIARAYATKRQRIRREFVNKVKDVPCVDCGIAYPPCVMDFDHVTGTKQGNIANAMSWHWDKLLEEIAKCDIVCSNCHRMRTYRRSVDKYIELEGSEDYEAS